MPDRYFCKENNNQMLVPIPLTVTFNVTPNDKGQYSIQSLTLEDISYKSSEFSSQFIGKYTIYSCSDDSETGAKIYQKLALISGRKKYSKRFYLEVQQANMTEEEYLQDGSVVADLGISMMSVPSAPPTSPPMSGASPILPGSQGSSNSSDEGAPVLKIGVGFYPVLKKSMKEDSPVAKTPGSAFSSPRDATLKVDSPVFMAVNAPAKGVPAGVSAKPVIIDVGPDLNSNSSEGSGEQRPSRKSSPELKRFDLPGLMRATADPDMLTSEYLNKLCKEKTAYILYEHTLFMIDIHPFKEMHRVSKSLSDEDYEQLHKIFPDVTDKLVIGKPTDMSLIKSIGQFRPRSAMKNPVSPARGGHVGFGLAGPENHFSPNPGPLKLPGIAEGVRDWHSKGYTRSLVSPSLICLCFSEPLCKIGLAALVIGMAALVLTTYGSALFFAGGGVALLGVAAMGYTLFQKIPKDQPAADFSPVDACNI